MHPNNNNKNKNKRITTTRVVDFETKERRKALRERMGYFEFKRSFIEKMLMTYPLENIEAKVELYASGKEVRNKEGWLVSALKEGYGEEEEVSSAPVTEKAPLAEKEEPKILPREEALAWIRKIRSPPPVAAWNAD